MRQQSVCIHFISLLFGIGSWIAVTGFWVELPVLITRLPEGWKLASYLTFMIQAANIATLVYYFLRKWTCCSEISSIHAQMIIGTISCVMLICHWNHTVHIWGQERSVILFVAAFGLSVVDCTSSVTFLPFMARFRDCYLTPYLIGEGLSGFLATLVALLQGVDETAEQCSNGLLRNDTSNSFNNTTNQSLRFSAEVFFSSLLLTLLISWFAFFYLLYSPLARREQLLSRFGESEINSDQLTDAGNTLMNKSENKREKSDAQDVIELREMNFEESKDCKDVSKTTNEKYTSSKEFWCLQVLMCFCCLTTFGLMPPLQPYSSLPYGNAALHFTVVFAGLSYPLGCFLAMFIKCDSSRLIYSLTAVGTLIAIYVIVAALMSPFPPLLQSDKQLGAIVIVCAWIAFTVILSYVKTVVTQIMNDKGGNEALFWVGMFTQIGSAVGAAFMFVAINYSNWFKDRCTQ